MKKQEQSSLSQTRKDRVLARGETSDHAHIVVGEDVKIERNSKGEIIIETGKEEATIRHLIESTYLQTGQEVWTKEHKDIKLPAGNKYKYVPQVEKDPYDEEIRKVQD